MHVLMVTDAYPPLRTSCAVQMYDLGQAFVEEGHQVTIITPLNGLQEKIRIQHQDGVRLVQVRVLKTKDVNYAYRTFAEFINPFLIWRKLKKSPEFLNAKYDGIVWYSPTIFWGPLIKSLKKQFCVKAYLILRDIFPDWALDLGLIRKGLIYKFLKKVEYFQYLQADIIGVQSPNNLKYFKSKNQSIKSDIEVLWNWIGGEKETPCSIDLTKTTLAGRKIFVYAGNMGISQSMNDLIRLAELLKDENDIGFVFVGRGAQMNKIREYIEGKKIPNVLFFDEIAPSEIAGLYRQCCVGLISLDSRHRSHNIPGKFLGYVRANLGILAFGNQGNDLEELIHKYGNGVYLCDDQTNPRDKAIELIRRGSVAKLTSLNQSSLMKLFLPKNTVGQILKKFQSI